MLLHVVARSGRELVLGGLEVQTTVADLKTAFHDASKRRKARPPPCAASAAAD
jgi:hypothetical protein